MHDSIGVLTSEVAMIRDMLLAQGRREDVNQHVVNQINTISQAVDRHVRDTRGADIIPFLFCCSRAGGGLFNMCDMLL